MTASMTGRVLGIQQVSESSVVIVKIVKIVSRMSLHLKLVELWPGLRGELHQGQVRLLPGGAHLLQQELLVLLLAGDQAWGDREPDPTAVP